MNEPALPGWLFCNYSGMVLNAPLVAVLVCFGDNLPHLGRLYISSIGGYGIFSSQVVVFSQIG
jgi:hypothetical protein